MKTALKWLKLLGAKKIINFFALLVLAWPQCTVNAIEAPARTSLQREHWTAPDGHFFPDAFDFVKPGITREAVNKRLGEPYVSSPSVVVKGTIDLFPDEPPSAPRQGPPIGTEEIVYYDYRPDRYPSEFARIVFRKNKVWYAMLPPRASERSRERIFARYGNLFEEQKIHRRRGHVLSVHVVLWRRKQGLAFVEVPGQGISHRVVFPPEA